MPFITEELYHRLPRADTCTPSICVSSYPEMDIAALPPKIIQSEQEFDQLFELIKSLRSTVMDRKLPPKTTKLYLIPNSDSLREQVQINLMALQALVRTVGTVQLWEHEEIAGDEFEMVELMNENEKLKCKLYIVKA